MLKEKKKKNSLAVEKMRDRPNDGGSKVEGKGDKNGNGLCWLERKIGSCEILPHLTWLDYKLCLVVKDAYWIMYKGTDNDSVHF